MDKDAFHISRTSQTDRINNPNTAGSLTMRDRTYDREYKALQESHDRLYDACKKQMELIKAMNRLVADNPAPLHAQFALVQAKPLLAKRKE